MTTNLQDLQTLDIPFKKLCPSDENVRTTTASEEGLAELTASIRSHGLLQSLVVQKARSGKFSVVAGKRRFLAVSQLVGEGAWPANSSIPCRLISETADVTELSLAENVQREAMHPADEFRAFQRLLEHGLCVADVAARFGVSEAVVNKRLALARVSPQLLNKYQAGEMNLELLGAFTLTDDHELQERIWKEMEPQSWNRQPRTVRRLLSQDAIPASDKRVRFVGLELYEASGGLVKRDLFSQEDEDEDGTYILDPVRLNRLASEKLEERVEELKTEGWKWVEVQPEMDSIFLGKHRRLYPEESPLSSEANEEWEALSVEREELEKTIAEEESEDREADEPVTTRLDEIEERLIALQDTRKDVYPAAVKAACGVLVTIGHDGSLRVVGGLLRKEDEAALDSTKGKAHSESPSLAEENPDGELPPYSASLLEALTAQKTTALAIELAGNPRVALAAVVHAQVLSHFGLDLHLYGKQSCLQFSSSRPYLGEAKDSRAATALAQQEAAWLRELPHEREELWRWCLVQDSETLLRLLAFCAGASLNAIQSKNDAESGSRILHADALARALAIDMTRWFTPTAENFFDHVSKARIADALTEAGKAPDRVKLDLKKAQFAKIAEFEMQGTNWLPGPVRIATPFTISKADQDQGETEEPQGRR